MTNVAVQNAQLAVLTIAGAPAEISITSLVCLDGLYNGFCAGSGMSPSYGGSEALSTAAAYGLPIGSTVVPALAGNTIAKYGWSAVSFALKAGRIGGAASNLYNKIRGKKKKAPQASTLETIADEESSNTMKSSGIGAQYEGTSKKAESEIKPTQETGDNTKTALTKAKDAAVFVEQNERKVGMLVKGGGTVLGAGVGLAIFAVTYGLSYVAGATAGLVTRF